MRNAVVLFQNPAQPNIAGRLKIRATDSFPYQILRRLDAGVDVDKSKTVTKSAMKKDRDRGNRYILRPRDKISADIEFTDGILEIARHAPMTFARPVAR